MKKFVRGEVIRSFECDPLHRQRPDSLLGWIMDAAEDHASLLGIGREFCAANGYAWVEVNLVAEIRRWPEWKERVEISTWTAPASAVIAAREFLMQDESGEELVRSTCQWALIDARRRAPVPLKRAWAALNLDPGQLPPLENYFPKPPKLGLSLFAGDAGERPVRTFVADWHQMDFNGHINNAVYLTWAMNSLPGEFLRTHRPQRIAISFRKESSCGERVESYLESAPGRTSHQLVVDGEIRAALEISWVPA